MPTNRSDIIAEMKGHTDKFGAGLDDRCVGAAEDPRSPFFESRRSADVFSKVRGSRPANREAPHEHVQRGLAQSGSSTVATPESSLR